MDKKICVIGGGRWGKNHIRTLAGLGCLAAVVEADAVRLKEYTELYPGIKGYADMDEAIACGYDGYTVALPAELHYPAGRKLLEKRAERYAGKADDAHRRAVCRTGGTGATHGSAPDGGACPAVSSGVP